MPESEHTLVDASVAVIDGQTIMKFTKTMKETGQKEITFGENNILWAYGTSDALGNHRFRSQFVLNLSSGLSEEVKVPNMKVWLAHGGMAFLAWGVLLPISVNASLFRDLRLIGSLWFKCHQAFNTAVYALFVALFFIAVSYTTKEGTRNFNDSHGRMGLVMLILTTFQMLFGIFRPRLTFSGSDKERTKVRKGWEGGHRLLGAALLLCGFWQMSSGIKLFSAKYSVSVSYEGKASTAYCVWIGAMPATILVGIWYSKIRKTKSSNPKFTSPAIEDTDINVLIPKDRTVDAEYDSADEESSSDPSCAPPILDYNHSCFKVKDLSAYDIKVDDDGEEQRSAI